MNKVFTISIKKGSFIVGIKKGFTLYGHALTMVINCILLTTVYILGIGLTALVARVTNKHFLDLKINKSQKSYWKDLNLGKKPFKNYLRQF